MMMNNLIEDDVKGRKGWKKVMESEERCFKKCDYHQV